MKVGDIITIDRLIQGGTGYYHYPVLLTGGVALLGSKTEVERGDDDQLNIGGLEGQYFSFQFLRAGKAEVQLARFRSFEPEDAMYEQVMTFDVEPQETEFLGTWTQFDDLEEQDQEVFDAAVTLIGVTFMPEKVSKQIVNGTNYRFFCYGRPAVVGEHRFPVILKVFKNADGEVELKGIERVVL